MLVEEDLDSLKKQLDAALDDILQINRHTLRELVNEVVEARSIFKQTINDLVKRTVIEALTASQGNKAHAAKSLGIDRRSIYRYLKEWGLPANYGRASTNQISADRSANVDL